ncbi:hypothetical protein GMD78_16490 [Ornithinibacillus sp. L9]|uniref:DUF4129 domain-containing protein n=1 Tax=Ornithinibacillus caprae TaxID=2678566 RepID=A0A6N8FLE7_9BACI|nr:hypothetical protein [Ornithinibacillus caprae]MUK89971.1 hypothetical protein [Ornithinibacillus caprae]
MENKNLLITHAYHFISEAIIIFLLLLPATFHHYEGIPYWIYLVIISCICILFSLYAKFDWNHVPYIVTVPIIVLLFHIVGLPLLLSIILALLLTWRYIAIRSEMHIKRENFYLITTIILGTVLAIFIRDSQALMFVFIQLILVVIGNIISHTAVIKKIDQKAFNRSFWYRFLGILSFASLSFYLLTDVIRNAFLEGYLYITNGLISGLSNMLGFLPDIKLEDFVDYGAEDSPAIGELENPVYQKSISEIPLVAMIYFGLTALAIGLGVFLIIRYFRTRFNFKKEVQEEKNLYQKSEEKLARVKTQKRKYRKQFKKIDHPVRKVIYQFEHYAAKHQKGRKHFETIEEWLRRIGYNANLEVYQKVRYGDIDVSDKEVELLLVEVGNMEVKLKN